MSNFNFSEHEVEEQKAYKSYDVHEYKNISFEFIDKDNIVVLDNSFKSPLTGELIPVRYQFKQGFFYPVDIDDSTPSILNKKKPVNLDFNIQLLHERKIYMERNNLNYSNPSEKLNDDFLIDEDEQEI